MRAHYLNEPNDRLLELDADLWSETITIKLAMSETPLSMQPTEAVRVQMHGREYGQLGWMLLSAVHNNERIFFRLQWDDPVEDREILDNDQFTDAAAIMLPSVPDAPLLLMGMEGRPVNAAYWRADEGEVGRNIIATGFGTTQTVDRQAVVCRDRWNDGRWTVIISRPLRMNTRQPVAQLSADGSTPYGVAVWAGSNQERAGIKSFTLSKEDLMLDATK